MNIKNIEKKHVEQINAIRNYYINNTNYIFSRTDIDIFYELEFFRLQSQNGFPSIVCVDDDENVIGFAYLAPFRTLDGYDRTMELTIYVEKNSHKQGIGNALYDEIERLATGKFHTIVSAITSDNYGSIEFHKKKGYVVTGELKESGYVNGKYLDVTFMQKIL